MYSLELFVLSLVFILFYCFHLLQRTATAFIEKDLPGKYPEYVDFVQPVQVAIYEMKLGVSLVVSNLMEKRALNTMLKPIGESRTDSYTMDVLMVC